MTRTLRLVLPLQGALLLLLLPVLSFAQSGPGGMGIPGKIVPCSGVACKCSDLVTLAQNLINTGIFLVVVLSAALFAYAGFQYLTSEAGGKIEAARTLLKNVAKGLVLMLIAWLLVDTLMKSVLGGNFGPWNAVEPVDTICRKLNIT